MLLFRAVPEKRAIHRALLLMGTSAAFFGLMAFSAKRASEHLSGPQVAMIRFAIGLLPCIFVPRYRRSALKFKRVDLLLYRGLFGGIAVLLYFIAIEHTSVGVATLLNYTAPIFSGVLSVVFIGEQISPRVLIPLPVALIGIFLVIHAHAAPGDVFGFGKWELIGLASGICSGAAVTAMRAARRGENSWSVYGSFCSLGLLTTMPLAIVTWKTPHGEQYVWLAATSLCAIFAQLLLTFSLRWVDAMTVGVISQLAVVVSMALGAIFLDERITTMAAIGSMLTIGGVVGVTYVTSLSKQQADAVEVAPES
jgi:drug/metabolite transporter (DMT)-like permease